jgi:glycine cleavage system H protein
MVEVPSYLRFTTDHLWLRVDGGGWSVGITRFAESKTGGVVFVDVPRAGVVLRAGAPFSFLESSKAVVDLIAPVSAVVVAGNERLAVTPDLVNRDPYGDGWICVVKPQQPTQLDALLDATAYQDLLNEVAKAEDV